MGASPWPPAYRRDDKECNRALREQADKENKENEILFAIGAVVGFGSIIVGGLYAWLFL